MKKLYDISKDNNGGEMALATLLKNRNGYILVDKYSSIELAVYYCIKEMCENKIWLGINYIYDDLKENGIYEISILGIKKAIRKLKNDGLIVSETIFDEDTHQLCGKGWVVI